MSSPNGKPLCARRRAVSVAQSSLDAPTPVDGVELQLPVGHRQRQRRELQAEVEIRRLDTEPAT